MLRMTLRQLAEKFQEMENGGAYNTEQSPTLKTIERIVNKLRVAAIQTKYQNYYNSNTRLNRFWTLPCILKHSTTNDPSFKLAPFSYITYPLASPAISLNDKVDGYVSVQGMNNTKRIKRMAGGFEQYSNWNEKGNTALCEDWWWNDNENIYTTDKTSQYINLNYIPEDPTEVTTYDITTNTTILAYNPDTDIFPITQDILDIMEKMWLGGEGGIDAATIPDKVMDGQKSTIQQMARK